MKDAFDYQHWLWAIGEEGAYRLATAWGILPGTITLWNFQLRKRNDA